MPAGIPPHSQGPVERALIEAERALRRTLSTLPSPFNRAAWDVRRARSGDAALAFVLHVIAAVIDPECKAIRQGHWSIQQSHEAVEKYLKDYLIPQAYTLARLSTYVRVSDFEPFREALLVRVQDAEVWGAYLDALLEVTNGSIQTGTDASVELPTSQIERPIAPDRSAEDSEATIKWRWEKLRAYATRLGLDQDSKKSIARPLARHFGMSSDTLYAIVRGDKRYALEREKKVLDELDVSEADWHQWR